jgi:excisionase family DNA binding protein
MIGVTSRPVSPRPAHELGHDRAVANGKNVREGAGLRTSAWLPPGLALGWLAVLATFIHGIGNLLAAWAATVSLVVLLGRWRPTSSPGSPSGSSEGSDKSSDSGPPAPDVGSEPSGEEEGPASGTAHSTSTAENAASSAARSTDLPSGVGSEAQPIRSDSAPRGAPNSTVSSTTDQSGQTLTTEGALALGLQVLTADEAASVLRVEAEEIITAISNGELPGNRIGRHWRVDQGALTRWLQGRYETSPTEPSHHT